MSKLIVACIIGVLIGVVFATLITSGNRNKYYMKGESMIKVLDGRYELSEEEIRQAAVHCANDNSMCDECNFRVKFSKSPSHRGACAEAFAKLQMLDRERIEDDGK